MKTIDCNMSEAELQLLVASVQHGEPVRLSSPVGHAVVLSETDYRSLTETLALLSDPEMASDIAAARITPVNELIEWSDSQ